jgi:hypothetical protein
MSIASLVLGILGIVLGFFGIGIVPAILGLIFGCVSLKKCKSGLGIAGLVCSIVGIVISVVVIVATPSTPKSGTVSNTDSVTTSDDSAGETSGDNGSEETLADMVDHEIYAYSDMGDTFAFVVVKNNADVAVDVDTNVNALDESGSVIGTYSFDESCIAPGQSYPLWHMFEGIEISDIADFDYSVTVTKSNNTTVVDDDLPWSVDNTTDDGVIITVTNNHDYDVQYLNAYALFFRGDELVGFGDTFIDNVSSDCILQSGQTVTKQIDTNSSDESFDSVEVYLKGYRR